MTPSFGSSFCCAAAEADSAAEMAADADANLTCPDKRRAAGILPAALFLNLTTFVTAHSQMIVLRILCAFSQRIFMSQELP